MFSKKRIIFSTTSFFLIGLLAFNLCLAHPASDHAHESTSENETACSSEADISGLRLSRLLGVPDPLEPHPNSLLTLWPPLKDPGIGFKYVSKIGDPFVYPVSTTKRYQYTCTYLL